MLSCLLTGVELEALAALFALAVLASDVRACDDEEHELCCVFGFSSKRRVRPAGSLGLFLCCSLAEAGVNKSPVLVPVELLLTEVSTGVATVQVGTELLERAP